MDFCVLQELHFQQPVTLNDGQTWQCGRGAGSTSCRGGRSGAVVASPGHTGRTAGTHRAGAGDTRLSHHPEPQGMRLDVIQPAELSARACGGDKSPQEASINHQDLSPDCWRKPSIHTVHNCRN